MCVNKIELLLNSTNYQMEISNNSRHKMKEMEALKLAIVMRIKIIIMRVIIMNIIKKMEKAKGKKRMMKEISTYYNSKTMLFKK